MGCCIEHFPILAIAIPLLGAFITVFLGKIHKKLPACWCIFVVFVTLMITIILGMSMYYDEPVRVYTLGGTSYKQTVAVDTDYPIRIILEPDLLSIFMAIITVGIAFVAMLFSYKFMENYSGLDKYYTVCLLIIAGLIGMLFTGDLFNLFVFFEIASIATTGLIAFLYIGVRV